MKTLFQTLLLSCLLVQTATAAETRLSVRQDGNILTMQGRLDVPVNQTVAWTVLTDYARFSDFVPGINSSRVLEQRNSMKLIEQRGMFIAGSFRMPFQGVVQVEEHKRDGQPEIIRILFVSGPLKDVQGEWKVKPGMPLELS